MGYSAQWSSSELQPQDLHRSVEALELRDDKSRSLGKSVLKAVANVNDLIAPKLMGMNVRDQAGVDNLMVVTLDGSKNEWGWSKSKLAPTRSSLCP